MKGIILAGGTGSRLYPSTLVSNKHLLPVYDKPMIYYPLATLMLAGIREILIITNEQFLDDYQSFLGNGHQWGIEISYEKQNNPRGIAESFIIGESFIGQDNVCLILGDNIFQGSGLQEQLNKAQNQTDGANLFAYYVDIPKEYGIVAFDDKLQAHSIEEKPQSPKSNYAVTGLYFYDNHVIDIAKSIKPSTRGELEITDVNRAYLENSQLHVNLLGRGFVWLDMGTPDSLLAASNYIQVIEKRQGLKISCVEEIAWRMKFIDDEQFLSLASKLKKTAYGQYLMSLIHHEFI